MTRRENPFSLERLPTVKGDGLSLRALADKDAGAVLELFADPDVIQFMSIDLMASRDDALAFIADIDRLAREGTLYQWGIDVDGEIVGTVTFSSIDSTNRRAEIGFAVLRRMWGTGIVSRAVPIAIRYGFETMSLHRIEADVDPVNTASLRALERAGFTREGLLRERYLMNDEPRDAIVLGLLRSEWQGA